ncbi:MULTISPECIES: hypothetical protein [unclassified Streptomyces]|uniref:hypothetical protein n=1 Tax=unclassified Streptomyces TaxID=2593676 RepID=UPI0034216213
MTPDLSVTIDTLVVEVDEATVRAVAEGRVEALAPALLAALRGHPAFADAAQAAPSRITHNVGPCRDAVAPKAPPVAANCTV